MEIKTDEELVPKVTILICGKYSKLKSIDQLSLHLDLVFQKPKAKTKRVKTEVEDSPRLKKISLSARNVRFHAQEARAIFYSPLRHLYTPPQTEIYRVY